ncbi:acyl carrier protein, partial [Acinetobacter baumannii]
CMTDVRAKIVEIINGITRPAKIGNSDPEKSLLAEGLLDSLDFASVLMAIEDEFDLVLQDADVEDLNSINKLVQFVSVHATA